jgi:N-acyl-D-amino-acid deacylase
VSLTDEGEKLRLLADENWRIAARASWDQMYPHSLFHDPTALTFLESESGIGPVGMTLADYMARTGIAHPSDALAEWVSNNGIRSSIDKRPNDVFEPERVARTLRKPKVVGNPSDGGAHGQILCGSGDNVSLLTDFVRDRNLLTIEEAVRVLSGQIAEAFHLRDRGLLTEGMRADLVVFALDEIERRPLEKVWDVPDGEGSRTYRYSRAAAPMRLTLCNGVATFDRGAITGRTPGEILGIDRSRAPS